MRLVLLLPVLLVALWMVCEGPSWVQAVPEPAGILDALPDTVKKIAHTLGNKDQGVPDKLKKKDSASVTRKVAANTTKNIPVKIDLIPVHRSRLPLLPFNPSRIHLPPVQPSRIHSRCPHPTRIHPPRLHSSRIYPLCPHSGRIHPLFPGLCPRQRPRQRL
nr:PREDICTED: apolipoprotein C-I [Equus przewalskii]